VEAEFVAFHRREEEKGRVCRWVRQFMRLQFVTLRSAIALAFSRFLKSARVKSLTCDQRCRVRARVDGTVAVGGMVF